MTQPTTDRILYALFCLSRDTCHIDASELGRAAEISPTQAAQALVLLEQSGLVDASRARLTMLGLARAAALSKSGTGGPRVNMRNAKPRKQAKAELPVAARSVPPPAPVGVPHVSQLPKAPSREREQEQEQQNGMDYGEAYGGHGLTQ